MNNAMFTLYMEILCGSFFTVIWFLFGAALPFYGRDCITEYKLAEIDEICDAYDALINTGRKEFSRENMRWNRFVHMRGCLCAVSDSASIKAQRENRNGIDK